MGYGNYLNKVVIDGKEYYVRFTVQRKKNESGLQSSFVSDVELYNPDQRPVNSQIIDRATDDVVGTKTDTKLQHFYEDANKSSKPTTTFPR